MTAVCLVLVEKGMSKADGVIETMFAPQSRALDSGLVLVLSSVCFLS